MLLCHFLGVETWICLYFCPSETKCKEEIQKNEKKVDFYLCCRFVVCTEHDGME